VEEFRGVTEMTDKRPDYLNCPMTPGVIRGIKERQENWDRKHPEEVKKLEELRGVIVNETQ